MKRDAYGILIRYEEGGGEAFTGLEREGVMAGVELKGLKGLKGLDNLLQEVKLEQPQGGNYFSLPVNFLVSGKYQPRTEFENQPLQELAASIKAKGIIQPLIVRKIKSNQYEIIAGERRWRAAKIAGLTEVPTIVRDVPDNTALAFAIIENIQRENLNPIEEALALTQLKEEFSMTHDEIAETVGRSRPTVTNLMRLLTLNTEVKDLLRQGKLEMGHARALLTLDESQQILAAHQIVEKEFTVRRTEYLVQKIKHPQIKINKMDTELEKKVKHWNETLSNRLSLPVKIEWSGTGEGRAVIRMNSLQEIEWLVKNLKIN